MSERRVPDIMTPVTPRALYEALRSVAPELSRASLLVLLAQVAQETGWRSVHQRNMGNIKHVAGDDHDYCEFECDEWIKGQHVEIEAGKPGSQFRAYVADDASPEAERRAWERAATDYLAVLERRFPKAWPAVLAGDPAAFVHGLKLQGYFTGSELIYTHNVVALDVHLALEIPDESPLDPATISAMLANAQNILGAEQPTPPGDLPPAVEA